MYSSIDEELPSIPSSAAFGDPPTLPHSSRGTRLSRVLKRGILAVAGTEEYHRVPLEPLLREGLP